MNNTSAYANVLLKSPAMKPAATATAAVTPKRDYESDRASAGFQQTFKTAHDNQKSQDEKVAKSANPKKSTQAERHSDVKNNKETKNSKETNNSKAANETAVKPKSADGSADINRNAIDNEVVREQPVQSKNKDVGANSSTDGDSAQEVTTLVADTNPTASEDALMAANILNDLGTGVIPSALAVGAELETAIEASTLPLADISVKADELRPIQETISADIKAAPAPIYPTTALSPLLTKPSAETSIAANIVNFDLGDSTKPASQLLIKPESATTLGFVAEVLTNSNAITLESANLASAPLSPDGTVEVNKSSQPLVGEEPLLKQNLAQQIAGSLLDVPVNQPINPPAQEDAQALAMGIMVSAAPAKPLQPQVTMTEIPKPTELSDEVVDLLAPSVPEASATAKVAPTANLATTNNAVNPEVTTAQVQMNASKTAFEKTLQAIVSPDATSADDIAAPIPSSSSTSSATNSLLDSLMRGADQQTPAARSFVVQTAVPVPVGQPQWSQAVGEKVLWLAAQNVSSAEINLHPKDLGPIQVRVSVNQEQTTVSFTSHHAVVREVLDQNLNRLRDMFSEQGLNLVNVDVSDKSFSRQQGDAQGQRGQGSSQDVGAEEETAVAMSAIVQQRLVDHYA